MYVSGKQIITKLLVMLLQLWPTFSVSLSNPEWRKGSGVNQLLCNCTYQIILLELRLKNSALLLHGRGVGVVGNLMISSHTFSFREASATMYYFRPLFSGWTTASREGSSRWFQEISKWSSFSWFVTILHIRNWSLVFPYA